MVKGRVSPRSQSGARGTHLGVGSCASRRRAGRGMHGANRRPPCRATARQIAFLEPHFRTARGRFSAGQRAETTNGWEFIILGRLRPQVTGNCAGVRICGPNYLTIGNCRSVVASSSQEWRIAGRLWPQILKHGQFQLICGLTTPRRDNSCSAGGS